MFKTPICDMFGIEYPIIQGGMVWVSYADLCAAVSEAGGMGMLAGGSMTAEELRQQIDLVRQKTQEPFGVNVPIIMPSSPDLIAACIAKNVPVVTTSAGNPKRYVQALHDTGIKVIHVSPSVTLAVKAQEAGVDAIVAEGVEAGGHDGFDEITTMTLVPQVVDAVDLPVIAAGGIADSRGFIAALALGAQGVQMGTRFMATPEAQGHERFKQAVLAAGDNGTVITGRKLGPTRCLRNKLTKQIFEAEAQGADANRLLELIGFGRSRRATIEGDVEEGTIYCGQISGMIGELKPVKDIIREILAGAAPLLEQIQSTARA